MFVCLVGDSVFVDVDFFVFGELLFIFGGGVIGEVCVFVDWCVNFDFWRYVI